jgi:dienelactone hydrolase
MLLQAAAQASTDEETRVVIDSRGWQLVGDLRLPASEEPFPAVLMLNKAAGDRTVYRELAHQLAARGIASLRLDLPGHGESINLGRFVPGETDSLTQESMIWESDLDVTAAHQYLKTHARIDSNRIGMIGASYSGEEMAEAGRERGYARAYVELSPGSFSEASISGIDSSGVAWLFIVSNNERHLREITASVQARSKTVELIIIPGTEHSTRILAARPDMAERIAVWLAHQLR